MTSTTSIWASHGHNRIHHPGYETEQRTSPSTGGAALKRFLTSTGAEDFLASRRNPPAGWRRCTDYYASVRK
jgi:hypothetical protein